MHTYTQTIFLLTLPFLLTRPLFPKTSLPPHTYTSKRKTITRFIRTPTYTTSSCTPRNTHTTFFVYPDIRTNRFHVHPEIRTHRFRVHPEMRTHRPHVYPEIRTHRPLYTQKYAHIVSCTPRNPYTGGREGRGRVRGRPRNVSARYANQAMNSKGGGEGAGLIDS